MLHRCNYIIVINKRQFTLIDKVISLNILKYTLSNVYKTIKLINRIMFNVSKKD